MPDIVYSFIAFTLAATVSPGGATTVATASGIRFGFARSAPLILGIASGLAALAALGATGLGVVIKTLPALEMGIRLLGTTYLIWLSARIWQAGPPNTGKSDAATPFSYFNGIAVCMLNPKGWAMTMAAAAAFAALSPDPVTLASIMALAFALCAVLSLSLWCVCGALLASILKTPRHWTVVNRSLAVFLAASIVPLWAP